MIFDSYVLIEKFTNLGSAIIKKNVDFILKGLDDSLSWLMDNQFLIISLSILENFKEFHIGLDSLLFNLIHELNRNNSISDGDGPSIIKHPAYDDLL